MIACAPQHRAKVLFSGEHQAVPVLSRRAFPALSRKGRSPAYHEPTTLWYWLTTNTLEHLMGKTLSSLVACLGIAK